MNPRRLLRVGEVIGALVVFALTANAQTTSVTLQVTDADSQTWNNGTYSVTLVQGAGTSGNLNGVTFKNASTNVLVPNQLQTGSLSGTGGASLTLTPNDSIAPGGSVWAFTVCPQATAICFTQQVKVVGASQTITITPIGVRISMINPPPNIVAYTDAELVGPVIGQQYYNLTASQQRQWNGSAWIGIGAFNPAAPGTIGGTTPGAGHFTTLDATGGITAIADGVHAQIDALGGNSTPAVDVPNTVSWEGPSVATFTDYKMPLPSVAPTKNQFLAYSAPAGTEVPVQFVSSWLIRSVQAPAGDTVNCPNNTTANFATTAFTIPANELIAGKIFRVTLEFTLLTSAAPVNMGLNLLIGGVQVVTPLAVAPASASIANRPVGMSYLIQGTAAAGASVNVLTSPIWGGVAGTTVIVPFAISTITPPVALATNGTLAIVPQLFCSANTAGNGMTLQQVLVESN